MELRPMRARHVLGVGDSATIGLTTLPQVSSSCHPKPGSVSSYPDGPLRARAEPHPLGMLPRRAAPPHRCPLSKHTPLGERVQQAPDTHTSSHVDRDNRARPRTPTWRPEPHMRPARQPAMHEARRKQLRRDPTRHAAASHHIAPVGAPGGVALQAARLPFRVHRTAHTLPANPPQPLVWAPGAPDATVLQLPVGTPAAIDATLRQPRMWASSALHARVLQPWGDLQG